MDIKALTNGIKTLERFAITIYEFSNQDLDRALETALKCMDVVLEQKLSSQS
jgi:hypothetical protein